MATLEKLMKAFESLKSFQQQQQQPPPAPPAPQPSQPPPPPPAQPPPPPPPAADPHLAGPAPLPRRPGCALPTPTPAPSSQPQSAGVWGRLAARRALSPLSLATSLASSPPPTGSRQRAGPGRGRPHRAGAGAGAGGRAAGRAGWGARWRGPGSGGGSCSGQGCWRRAHTAGCGGSRTWCARAPAWRRAPCPWAGPRDRGPSTSRSTPGTAAARRPSAPPRSGPGAPASRAARPYRGSGHRRRSPLVPGPPAGSSAPSPAATRRLPRSPSPAGKRCAPKRRRRPKAAARGCRFTRSSSCRGSMSVAGSAATAGVRPLVRRGAPNQAVSRHARMEGCVSGLSSVCANQGPRAKPVR